MDNKKNLAIHITCLCLLCIWFVLCRYGLLSLHGMYDLPELLFYIGILVLGISFFAKARLVPVFTAFAYITGFVLGMLFRSEGTDPGGGRTSSLWLIWTGVYLFVIVAAVVGEWIAVRRKKMEWL